MRAVVYIDHKELVTKQSLDSKESKYPGESKESEESEESEEHRDCLDEIHPGYNSDDDDQVTCAICFHKLKRHIAVLECNHRFHLKCLTDWYNRPNCNYKCPMCFVQQDIVTVENDGLTPKRSALSLVKANQRFKENERDNNGGNGITSSGRSSVQKMLCCLCCKKKQSNQVININSY